MKSFSIVIDLGIVRSKCVRLRGSVDTKDPSPLLTTAPQSPQACGLSVSYALHPRRGN